MQIIVFWKPNITVFWFKKIKFQRTVSLHDKNQRWNWTIFMYIKDDFAGWTIECDTEIAVFLLLIVFTYYSLCK